MVEEKDNREKVVKEERAERELCWPLCMHAEPCFWANSICENYSLCIQYRQLFMSCFFPDLPRYSEGRLSPTGVRIVLGPKCLSVNALRKLLPLMKSFGVPAKCLLQTNCFPQNSRSALYPYLTVTAQLNWNSHV